MAKDNEGVEEVDLSASDRKRVGELLNGAPGAPKKSRRGIQQTVELPKIDFKTLEIEINGISPLIVHAWSKKAIQQMLDKQLGKASKGKEPKDPLQDFKGSLYPVLVDGKLTWGVPAPSFKAAAVTSANAIGLVMTKMRQAFHVSSGVVPILAEPLPKALFTEWDHKYEKELTDEHAAGISMRLDLVRLETGVADLRFRAFWPEWSALLTVEYNTALISADQLVMLIDVAGYGCGIAEWRPSAPVCRSGEYGRFRVKRG